MSYPPIGSKKDSEIEQLKADIARLRKLCKDRPVRHYRAPFLEWLAKVDAAGREEGSSE